MEVIKTIKLDDKEKEILEQALTLMYKIGDELNVTIGDIYDHLFECAYITKDNNFILGNVIDASDL